MTTDLTELLTREQALDLMPMMSPNKLRELTRDGKGPKFARHGTVLVFRRADILDWYPKYLDKMFSTTDTLPRKTGKAVKAGRNGNKA
jgi:hypothetical protein